MVYSVIPMILAHSGLRGASKRVGVTIVTDMMMAMIGISCAEEAGSIIMMAALWTVVGYGVRYSNKHLIGIAVANEIVLILSVLFVPYWNQHPTTVIA